ncbi:MAG: hypothetical protein CSB48_09280 [Proteobacteria bacterium]|nr:MAG: hypothetical protein CSB48_09280 [Pseudomonadota bacterium]PIE39983.1 MAG: hypothetical protein CSA51_03175 [Gammaproteobacteria bacterium]
MLVRFSTQLNCTESELWGKIIEPESLRFIASPLLTFVPVNPGVINSEWEVGRDYLFKLYLVNCIPLGLHTIQIVKIDKNRKVILSQEKSLLAPVWNHTISFREIKPGLVSYRDEIEFEAGWLTPVVFVFAHAFYRHRHRRWKVLLHMDKTDD